MSSGKWYWEIEVTSNNTDQSSQVWLVAVQEEELDIIKTIHHHQLQILVLTSTVVTMETSG